MVTLVAAETAADGLRIRIQRLDASALDLTSPKDLSLENGVLTLGEATMVYAPQGDAFRWK